MDGVSDERGYLLDNARAEAGQRFGALSELFDASTFRHLRRVGLDSGWHVWEVGAGGPSVPSWLAGVVGSSGRVLATDLDTSWMPSDAPYQVLRHDVGADASPGQFDLIHARLVLVHVPARDAALAMLADSLRPGGWLVLEDADPAMQPLVCLDPQSPAEELANRLKRGFRVLLAERGAELAFGRSLPRRLRAAGLVEVQADAFFPITGPACTELERATTEQLRTQLVSADIATDAEIDEHLRNIASGVLDLATSPMITAWGRRPQTV